MHKWESIISFKNNLKKELKLKWQIKLAHKNRIKNHYRGLKVKEDLR